MTSRINYSAPLKSVRTVRALKLEQCDPPTLVIDDPARLSDADLMNEAGVAFVWENAPGRSKVEQKTHGSGVLSTKELKPPPHQLLAPPSFLKMASPDVPKSPPLAGSPTSSGTNTENPANLFMGVHEFPIQLTADVQASTNSKSKLSTTNYLPPRPPRIRTSPPAGMQQPTGNDNPSFLLNRETSAPVSKRIILGGRPLSPISDSDQRPAGSNGEEFAFPIAHRHSLLLSSTLPTSGTGEGAARNGVRDQGFSSSVSADDGRGPLPLGALNRSSQDYLTERLRQGPSHLVKDFYMSGRHTDVSILPSSMFATLPNSCLPTRPNSASASETGSQSDEGDQTDAGDVSSRMNMNSKDLDARCQVSVLDGEQYEAARRTDPHARDFIMERFLPAAKAMVTETPDSPDRRSQRNTSLSTGAKCRAVPPGRSRFAFKDQFRKDGEGQEDISRSDVLSKVNFPRQVGPLRSSDDLSKNAPDSCSYDQSPSASFGNECSPSPAASFVNQAGSSPALSHDGQHEGAWIHAESDESNTSKDCVPSNFEDRCFPSNSANNNGLRSQTLRKKGAIYRVHNRRGSGNGEPSLPVYEGLDSRKEIGKSLSPQSFLGVAKDRLDERATQGDCNSGVKSIDLSARSPEMLLSGSLGALLRLGQQQHWDQGKSSVGIVSTAGTSTAIPPASILNHSRYKASHEAAAAAAAAAVKSSTNIDSHTETKPIYISDGVRHEDTSSHPGQLKVNVVRHQTAESSRGPVKPFENLTDKTWDGNHSSAASPRSPAPHGNDQARKALTTSSPNTPDTPIDEINASGWPLGKSYTAYARAPSSDSKDASFSSASDQSLRSVSNQDFSTQDNFSSDKFSPVSVLQPPLPKSPAESWLCKVRPPIPLSKVGNCQGPKPKKTLEYSLTDDSMDVKWEVLVKSENAQRRNKLAQEQKKGSALSAFERDILG